MKHPKRAIAHVKGAIMRKPRVIIYDDEASLLETSFSGWGYEVFSCRAAVVCPVNGSSAQECRCQTPCADLMISNFLMPKMTGTELFWRQAEIGCKVARKAKAIMSICSEERLLRLCKDSGYRFFEKPFNKEELTAWLSESERNFDLSKQLRGMPAEARYEFGQDIEYCLNSSGLRKKYVGLSSGKSKRGLGLSIFNPLPV
jgi:DNA-binding NtrC family response regulator